MNKIYKVVWNTVRNCYVVGSELISSKSGRHSASNGKSSSLKVTLTVLALCGMTTLGSGLAPAYAADAGAAVESQYVAVLVNDSNNSRRNYRTFDGHSYHKETVSGETYWVRDGYTIKYEENERYPGARKDNIIKAYKTDSYTASSDAGLLKSNQVMVESSGVSTLTGVDLDDVSGGTYVGATNSGSTSTPSSFNYMIKDDNGSYIDAGNSNYSTHFAAATKNSDGTYSYNGKVLSNDNLYVISSTDRYSNTTSKVGVFLTSSGKVYTGKVFGANNEVLMTTKNDDGTLYSYWGADTPDPNSKLADMTIGQFNQALEKVNNNSKAVAGDAIKKVVTTKATDGNGGTISLLRRGTYNAATGEYEGEHYVDGGLTLTSTGGTGGTGKANDVKIKVSNGTDTLTLDAGTKVEAIGTKDATTGLKINGEEYTIKAGKDYKAGTNVQISDDGTISATDNDTTLKAGKAAKSGNTYTIEDTAGNQVTLEDVASAATVTDNYNTLNQKINTTENNITNAYTQKIGETKIAITNEYHQYVDATENYVTGGSISGDTITLNRRLGGDVTISGLKDYVEGKDSYVTSASLKGNTLTITQNNGKGDYAIDLSEFANSFSGTDYRVIANPAEGSKGIYKPDASGNITLTVEDAKTGATSTVRLSDIASAATVTNNYKTLNQTIDNTKTEITNNYKTDINNAKEEITNNYNTAIDNSKKQITNEYTTAIDNTKNEITNNYTQYVNEKDKLNVKYDSEAKNTITLGGNGATTAVKITNLAAGTEDFDAVNFSQLKAVSNAENYVTGGSISGDSIVLNRLQGGDVTINGLKDYVEGKDSYVTSASLKGNTLTITQNNGKGDYAIDLSEFANSFSGTDYRVIANPAEGSKGIYKPDASGNITLTVEDAKTGATSTVRLSDIASAATVTNNYKTLNQTIDNTKTEITNNYKTDINNAKEEITNNYNTAIDNSKKQITNEYTTAIDNTKNEITNNYTQYVNEKDKLNVKYDSEAKNTITLGGKEAKTTVKLTNVAAGENDTDAVNVSQLKKVQNDLQTSDKYVISGSLNKTNGTLNLKVRNGDDVSISGLSAYQVSQDGSSYDAGSHKLTLNLKDALNTSNADQQVTFDGIASTADVAKATTEVKAGTNTKVTKKTGTDGNAVYTVDAKGTTVSADGNFSVTAADAGNNVTNYSLSLANTINIGKANTVTIDGTKGEITGLTNTTLDAADFGKAGRAATEEQLSKVSAKATAAKTTVTSGKNIDVSETKAADGSSAYAVALADNVSLGKDTIKLNGSDGSLQTTSGTASLSFNKDGLFVSGDTGSTSISGGTISINNGASVISGSQATFGGIKLNGESRTSTISGLSNTTTKYDGFATAGRAATEEQLKEVSGQASEAITTANKGWNLTTNGQNKTNIAPDATVNFASSNDNLVISNAGADLSFSLSDNLDLTNNKDNKGSVKVGENTALSNELLQVGTSSMTTSTLMVGNSMLTTDALTVGGLSYITSSGIDANHMRITNVAAGINGTDAVNVNQLNSAISGSKVSIKAGDGITVEKTGNQYTIKTNIKGGSTSTGTVTVTTEDNTSTSSGGSSKLPLRQMAIMETAEMAAAEATTTDVGKAMTIANTDFDLKFKTDISTPADTPAKVNNGGTVNIFGDDVNVSTSSKAGTDSDTIRIALNKDIKVDSITAKTDGGQLNIKSEVNMNSQKITNLAEGDISETSTDAVTGSQLYNTNQAVIANAENINSLSTSVNKLDSRLNRVGAGAAALAALHPLDFDPDNKWDFAAGYGNYAGANAVAIGTYYRPNENTMFSIGGSFGGGENMINAGVSFKLGSGSSGITTSKTVMAKKIKEQDELLKAQDAKMKEQDEKIAKLEALVAQQGEMIKQALNK